VVLNKNAAPSVELIKLPNDTLDLTSIIRLAILDLRFDDHRYIPLGQPLGPEAADSPDLTD